MSDNMRLPAEWEYESAVMMALPHKYTDWSYMLRDALDCYNSLVDVISKYHKVLLLTPDIEEARKFMGYNKNVIIVEIDTNDTWTRDYGPITVIDSRGNFLIKDFRFNGWGLKFAACYDNLSTSKLVSNKVLKSPIVSCQNFVLEGGGIESNGKGVLMTTASCQLSANRNTEMGKDEICERLKAEFGASQVLWLESGGLSGDDTDGHIDTLARFFPNDTIVYTCCDDSADEHFLPLQAMKREIQSFCQLDGRPYNLVELPLPDAVYDSDGNRLPATYSNFLLTDKALFLPVYNQPAKDKLAEMIFQSISPVPVEPVDCLALIQQHGSLHCATMQFPQMML